MTDDNKQGDGRSAKKRRLLAGSLTRREVFRKTGALAALPIFAGAMSGTAAGAEGTISNDSVEALILNNGAFELRTAESEQLTFPTPGTSGLTIQVDGTNYAFGAPGASERLNDYLTQETSFNDEETAATTEWELPGSIAVTQTLSLAEESIEFDLSVTNDDDSPHEVKIRYLHDYQVAEQDGAPIFVNGDVLTTETRFENPSFDTWQTYDQLPDPELTGQGTNGTVPDKIEFIHWPTGAGTAYEYEAFDPERVFYTPGENTSPDSDSAGLLYYELGSLDGGESDSITTYYGVGEPSETSLDNLQSSLVSFQNAVSSLLTTTVEARAQAHAEIYSAVGETYAENLVNYLGYAAGVGGIESGDIDDNLFDPLSTLADGVSQPGARKLYRFFEEMFSAVSAQDPTDEIATTFTQYLLGTADDLENPLIVNGETLEDIEASFRNDYVRRRSDAVEALASEEPSEAVVEQLVRVVNAKEERVRTRTDQLERELRDLAATVRNEGDIRVLGGTTEGPDVTTQSAFTGPLLTLTLVADRSTLVSGINPTNLFDGLGVVESTAAVDGYYSGTATDASLAWNQYSALYWTTLANWGSTGVSSQTVVEAMVADGALDSIGLSTGQIIDEYTGVEIELSTGLSNIPVTLVERMLDDIAENGGAAWVDEHVNDLAVTGVDAPDIAESDIGEGVAQQTATVTIQNQSDQAVRPTLDRANSGLSTVGVSTTRQIPDCGSYVKPVEELPTIDSGESAEVSVEYTVPVLNGRPRNVGRYDLRVSVTDAYRTDSSTDIDSFTIADDRAPDASIDEVLQGTIVSGDSERTTESLSSNLDRASFDMSYDGSDLDLHIYDTAGNHVGRNYDSGEFENQIPGATASGTDRTGESYEKIYVDDPDQSYDVEVVGLETDAGGTGYSTRSSEFAEINPILTVRPSRVTTGPAVGDRSLTIGEEGGDDSLTGVSLSATDLTGRQSEEVIPADNISFDRSGFDVAANGTETVQMSIDAPADLSPDQYAGQVEVQSGDETQSIDVRVFNGFVGRTLPRDIDDDGRLEDIDGDGQLTLTDVQLYFERVFGDRESPFVQANIDSFDFTNDGQLTLADVQALFMKYVENNPTAVRELDLDGGPTLRVSDIETR